MVYVEIVDQLSPRPHALQPGLQPRVEPAHALVEPRWIRSEHEAIQDLSSREHPCGTTPGHVRPPQDDRVVDPVAHEGELFPDAAVHQDTAGGGIELELLHAPGAACRRVVIYNGETKRDFPSPACDFLNFEDAIGAWQVETKPTRHTKARITARRR